MLLKKYILVIVLLSVIMIVVIVEGLILNMLKTNLERAKEPLPVEIRLPIINLATYDALYKKGIAEINEENYQL